MLSNALISTRDAITGFWDGARTAPGNVDLPTDDTYLGQIRMPSQALMLENRLVGRINGTGDGAARSASLKLDGTEIFALERPDIPYFEAQLSWIRAYADLRSDRMGEIFEQIDDMLSFFGALCYLDNGRRAYSLQLLSIVRRAAIHAEVPFKYYCRTPRPLDLAIEVQPLIQTPDHSAFPSGHATEAFAIATVLHYLHTGQSAAEGIAAQALPFRVAHRIAANRTVAGVHYPADSLAGAALGVAVGEAIHTLAKGGTLKTGQLLKTDFDAMAPDNPDFLLSNFSQVPSEPASGGTTLVADDIVSVIWERAAIEWPSNDTGGGEAPNVA